MIQQRRITAIVLLIVLLSSAACNLPGVTPQSNTQQTPDLTITALFEFITTAQAEQTLAVLPPSSASTSTPASVPPTAAEATTAAPAVGAPSATPVPPTSAPTDTPEPTVTEKPQTGSMSGPAKRPGPSVLAYYLQKEPTIDGVFDEWDEERYSASSVVFGGNRWSGAADLSSTFMIAWDDYNLYIAARVRDDKYVQNASGENLFKGDSVEILLDNNVAKDYFDRFWSSDDYQIGISPGKDTPSDQIEVWQWLPRSKEGELTTVKAAALPTDDGYRIEIKIPWDVLGTTPEIGKHFGFAFSVSDNDNSDSNVQQSMVSNDAGRHLTNPMTWGDLTLKGHH
jgi:hypothetical protein